MQALEHWSIVQVDLRPLSQEIPPGRMEIKRNCTNGAISYLFKVTCQIKSILNATSYSSQ